MMKLRRVRCSRIGHASVNIGTYIVITLMKCLPRSWGSLAGTYARHSYLLELMALHADTITRYHDSFSYAPDIKSSYVLFWLLANMLLWSSPSAQEGF